MCLTVLGFLLQQISVAQQTTVRGQVVDARTNESLPGVSILIKGTSSGTVTDIDGRYQITTAANSTLVFSYVGMKTQEIPIAGRTTVNVSLESESFDLDQVVVVGYGVQKKANLSGAVSTVMVDKTLESRPITDVGRALQGTTPGLIVTTTSGLIGTTPTIKIRGVVSTIGGGTGNPLILVDNVEVPDLSYINPDDIESISVLKDASTTAIYGARAAFGAILITSKSGAKDSKIKVSYSNNFSWATATDVPKHSRADLNLQYSYDQLNALKTTPTWEYGQVGYYYNPDVIKKTKEWIDRYGSLGDKKLGREMVLGRDFEYRASGGAYFYRPWDIYNIYYKDWTPQQNQNLMVSGGNNKTRFTISAGMLDQKGILKLFDDFYKRMNVSGFLSTDVNKWLSLRGRYMYAKTAEESPFLWASAAYDPQYYLYRWHQVYPYGTYQGAEFRGGVNDLKSARPVEDDEYYSRYTLGTTLTLAKGLTVDFDYTFGQTFATNHTTGGYVYGVDFWNRTSSPASDTFEEVTKIYSSASYDYAQYAASKNLRNTYNGYATYETRLNDHYFKIMAGANMEDAEYIYLSARRYGVYDFDKGEVNLAGGDQNAGSNHTWWSVAGFFGRINYIYKDKYIFEANGRYDGSSKFAAGKQWGFFPSASAAWRITEEPWMNPFKPVLSNLKLRISYGEVGNQDVPLNSFISTLSVTNPTASGAYWLINNNWVPYISIATSGAQPLLVDPTLTWETVSSIDLGADARFFNDKLGVTFDWYNRKTLDMLAPGETVPSTVGTTAPRRNFGELKTNGIELSVDYNHTFSNGLRLGLSGQFMDFNTIVSKYASEEDPQISSTYYEGKELGEIWGYKTVGLFQEKDFVWENGAIVQTKQADGQMKNTMAEGVPNQYIFESGLFKYSPGDVRFKDINGDGVINYGTNTIGDPGDRTVIGNTNPRYQYGFRVDANWKGFDAAIFFQGVGKRSIWATGNMILPGYYGAEANFAHTLDYWTKENTGAFYPRPMEHSQTAKWNYLPNDRYLLNVAYLRLKNLTFGYTLPRQLLKKVNVEKCRIYFNGENLFEFDKLGNIPIDPEIDWTTTTSADSRSFGRSYPYRRVVSFGVQLEF
jgi:TonB-linked SusC/RagA family outer membrane protein